MTAKTNIIYLWKHQDTPNNSRNNPKSFSKILFWEISRCWKSKTLQQMGDRTIPKISLIDVRKYGIWDQYLPEKHEMGILENVRNGGACKIQKFRLRCFRRSWIWVQYLSKKHETEFGNMGSIYVKKTWNGNLVIWDQYLSKTMKLKFGNMGSISFGKTWNGKLEIPIECGFSIKGAYTFACSFHFQLKELKHYILFISN